MTKIINPEYQANRELGLGDAEWQALKDKITTFLQGKAGTREIDLDEIRGLDNKFQDDRLWSQIKGEMGWIISQR